MAVNINVWLSNLNASKHFKEYLVQNWSTLKSTSSLPPVHVLLVPLRLQNNSIQPFYFSTMLIMCDANSWWRYNLRLSAFLFCRWKSGTKRWMWWRASDSTWPPSCLTRPTPPKSALAHPPSTSLSQWEDWRTSCWAESSSQKNRLSLTLIERQRLYSLFIYLRSNQFV